MDGPVISLLEAAFHLLISDLNHHPAEHNACRMPRKSHAAYAQPRTLSAKRCRTKTYAQLASGFVYCLRQNFKPPGLLLLLLLFVIREPDPPNGFVHILHGQEQTRGHVVGLGLVAVVANDSEGRRGPSTNVSAHTSAL